MSASCCAGSPKSEPAKVAEPKTTEVAVQRLAASSSECCSDKPAKSEKRACGCNC